MSDPKEHDIILGDKDNSVDEEEDRVSNQSCEPSSRAKKNHPTDLIIVDVNESRKTLGRSRVNYRDMVMYASYASAIEQEILMRLFEMNSGLEQCKKNSKNL